MEQPTTTSTNTPTFILDANELIRVFTNFLQFDIAAGGASAETIRTYWCEAKQYLLWCEANQLQPLTVTRDAIKIYRHYLAILPPSISSMGMDGLYQPTPCGIQRGL
jgi:integrase/recombinase XerD